MITEAQICSLLQDLPTKWRDKLTEILIQIVNSKGKPSCQDVKDCETLTVLSPFTVSGSTVSIKYTDEHLVQVTRSFDLAQVINQSLDGLNANCLTDDTTWSNLTFSERIQLLIDGQCDCCSTTTTTTTP